MSDRRVTLDLERGGKRIAGRITVPDSTPKPFTGYVELIAALEAARAWPRPAGEGPKGPGR